jgi:hypothetical protein
MRLITTARADAQMLLKAVREPPAMTLVQKP